MLSYPKLEPAENEGVVYFTDDALFSSTGVRIAFLGRHGGVSSGEFSTLNVGKHVGDNLQDVTKNRKLALQALAKNADDLHIYSPHQVHGDKILELVTSDLPEEIDADGVICDCKNVAPMLCFADCCPVILVAENGVFAVVHAGWRGVVNRISSKALKLMVENYCCDIATINAYVGPHLRQCCFEVGGDVAKTFSDEFGDSVVDDNSHVSMVDALKLQLVEAGLDGLRFCDLNMCTKCMPGTFFSYRATDGKCGRHGAIAFKE